MPSALAQAPSPFYSYRKPGPEDVYNLYTARRASQGEDVQRMRDIQAVMNNDIVLPLPELSQEERPMVANLAQQGMKQMGARVASVDPVCIWPTIRPGIKASVDDTKNRRLVMNDWHARNDLRIMRGQRGMRLLAYACTPVVIKPYRDKRTGASYPKWYSRHPLHTYPSETEFNDYCPDNVIFEQLHSYGWLKRRFMDQCLRISKPAGWDNKDEATQDETMFKVLEYMDAYYSCMVLVCPDATNDPYLGGSSSYGTTAEFLCEADNYAGIPLAVIPGSISLDKQLGEYDGIIGMYQAQAALMALGIIAQRRSVFQREWAVSNPNEQVQVVTIPDPATGRPGEIRGGQIIPQMLDPSYRSEQLQDRIEHAIRQTASIPSEFGGMSQSDNVRTGRRGAQVMGAAINFTIAQAQDIFAKSQRHEDEVAIAIDRTYFNSDKKKYFVMTRAWQGEVTYTPSELWKYPQHFVEYPINGVDADTLPVVGGQRISMNTMSRYRFMQIDPMIPDADAEQQQIIREAVLVAFLQSITAMGADPNSPQWQPIHFARFDELLAKGNDPYEAMKILQRELQEQQATQAPNPAAAQPGMSPPGMGVEQPTQLPDQSQRSVADLTARLRALGPGGAVDRAAQRTA